MGGGRGGQPKLTISSVRKSKSTFNATAHTRLLGSHARYLLSTNCKTFFFFSDKSGGITFGQSVVPICLPSPKLSSRQFGNVTISGWGKVNYEGFSTAVDRGLDTLQDAQVPIVDSAVCASDKVSKVTNLHGLRFTKLYITVLSSS